MRKPPINRSFFNAFHGIFLMMQSERNFQIQIFALIINLFLIAFLKLSSVDASLILLCSFAVLSCEILNTSIEKICDIIQPEFDSRIKFIKDAAAGAVLFLTIAAILVALLIYPKYLTDYFSFLQ